MRAEKQSLPVWYFIGWLLQIYGVLLVGAGSGVLAAASPTAQADADIGIWWGALLILIGLIYVWSFRRRQRREEGTR